MYFSQSTEQRYRLNIHLASIWSNFINWVFVSTIIYPYNSKTAVKFFLSFIGIKHTNFFYSWVFDWQHPKVLNNGIRFYPSNLIRVKFKVKWPPGYLFIALPWIYWLSSKTHYNKLQSKKNTWWKFHIHPSLGRLFNCNFKKLGMVLN